jgi:predicted DCC family thiol-disulfide oxidoreductase YuxK
MPERDDRLVVLFDRDCDFCGWVARQLHRIDRAQALVLMPLQDAASDSARPDLAAVAQSFPLERELHVVLDDGAVSSGGDALIEIFRRLPGGALVAFWSRLPGARGLAGIVYGVAARNRAALGRLLVAAGAECRTPISAPGSDTSRHRGSGRGGGGA